MLNPLGSRASIGYGLGMSRPVSASSWWSGAYAAWQAKGAASYAASLVDLTGNGKNLTEGSAPTWDAGTGWTFNGGTNVLYIPDLGLTGAAARSVLIRCTFDTNNYPVSLGPDVNTNYAFYRLRADSGNLRFEIVGAGYTSSLAVSAVTVQSVAAAYSGGAMSNVILYVGANSESVVGANILNTVEGGNRIGAQPYAGRFLNGVIESVGVFGFLSSAQVAAKFALMEAL